MSDVSILNSYIKLFLAFPAIILLAYFSLRLSARFSQGVSRGETLRVVEKVALHKNQYLLIVKAGTAYHLMSSTDHEIKLLRSLDAEEVSSVVAGTGSELQGHSFGDLLTLAAGRLRKKND
ncbi:MAG: flagellar biosynthetic protein FliO [Erysipelotrichaceae bacterium]|nr:flagellar biosynthetic protein FliO [Erysipelotrichaceae bacterium]